MISFSLMGKKYNQDIQRKKIFQVVFIALCLLALSVYVFMITRPEITVYEVEDSCGPISGSVMHPIDDVDSCSNACNAQCLSFQKEYHDSEFIDNLDDACNLCTCYCKG